MAWRPARSLVTLHNQLKTAFPRAAPPATAVTSWGLKADDRHESTSDHAAKDFPGWGTDIVTACDFPHAPALGLHARNVLDAIRASRDPRVKYGISQGQMFSSYSAHGYPPWTWRPYTGSDGHFSHSHLSVVGDTRADQTHPWTIGTATPQGDLMALTDQQQQDMWEWLALLVSGGTASRPGDRFKFAPPFAAINAALAASAQREQDMLAAIAALAAGGSDVDTAAIIAAINARTTDVTGALATMTARVADLEAELAEATARDAAAAQAAAQAYTDTP